MTLDALMALIRSRRSVRRFAAADVARERIAALVEAARWAPSNHNRQGWKFIVLDDRAAIGELAERVGRSVTAALAGAGRLAAAHGAELVGHATAFAAAPAVILVMHKRPAAVGRELLAGASGPLAGGEALSAAMAVQNLLLAAEADGLGACVMTAPLLAGEVWAAMADLPAGFEPTCLVAVGEPAERPEPPRRKPIGHVLEYR